MKNPSRAKKPILCVGTTPAVQRSMIFPKLTIDAVNRATEVLDYPSGKSLNVARVLHELRENPIATGFLGGSRGEFCRTQLNKIGLKDGFIFVSAPTRMCTTIIDSATGAVTELVEESTAVLPQNWIQLYQKIAALLPSCSFAIFSGSLPPGAPADLYRKWLGMCEDAGVRPIVDARGEPLRQAMAQHKAIVKVNREEFASTIQEDLADDEALKAAMRSKCPQGGMIAVTDGKTGAWAWDGEELSRTYPPEIEAINPIGSGDAFAAGLAVGLSSEQPLALACRLATAAAASNATSRLAGDIRYNEVMDLLDEVRDSRFVEYKR